MIGFHRRLLPNGWNSISNGDMLQSCMLIGSKYDR